MLHKWVRCRVPLGDHFCPIGWQAVLFGSVLDRVGGGEGRNRTENRTGKMVQILPKNGGEYGEQFGFCPPGGPLLPLRPFDFRNESAGVFFADTNRLLPPK